MRKNLKFPILALGVIAGGLLSSCTVDVENDFTHSGNMLAKAPEVKAYSGDHYWGAPTGTRSILSNEPHKWYKVQDYPLTDNLQQTNPNLYEAMTHAPKDVSSEEWAFVKDYLEKHPDEGSTVCDLTDYFIQWAGKSYDNYDAGKDWNGASHNVTGSSQMDYIEIDGVHLTDYNGTSGPITLCENWPLTNPAYHDSYGNQENMKYDHYRFYYINYNGEWNLYLCFDYTTKKDSGEYVEGDKVFSDWVLKITPADGSAILPPTEGPTTCEKCGDAPHEPGLCPNEDCTNEECHPTPTPCPKKDCEHEQHSDHGCATCFEEGRINDCSILYFQWLLDQGMVTEEDDPRNQNSGGNNSGTTNPGYEKGKDEVEVNLALDNKTHDLLESHLSIHVRKATDVEIFIPVPAQYYCAADDMEIVLNHGAGNFIHGGPQTTKFQVGEKEVKLTVSFENDGIRITTEGITQEVIDYCWANFKDGITFEVWNYFNDPDTGLPYINMNDLKEYLDRSTVKFLNEIPSQYVNSFGRDNGKYGEENPDGKDFHVTPVDDHNDSFQEPYEDYHLNGSSNNDIYKKK